MAQSFFFFDDNSEQDVTSQTSGNSYADIDCSAFIPAGATGAIYYIEIGNANPLNCAFRKNGSTDTRNGFFGAYAHNTGIVGLDADRIFEFYYASETAGTFSITIIGYTTAGVTLFDNVVDKSLTSYGAWTDIDCSSNAPGATGLIFKVEGRIDPNKEAFGFRKNGSTDNIVYDTYGYTCTCAVVGCDSSQVCEGYAESSYIDFQLMGYITSGVTFYTNSTDVTPGSTAAWTDMDALPEYSGGGIYELVGVAGRDCAVRPNGYTFPQGVYKRVNQHSWGITACDSDRIVEGYIQDAAEYIYLLGWCEGTGMPGSDPAYEPYPTNSEVFGNVAKSNLRPRITQFTLEERDSSFTTNRRLSSFTLQDRKADLTLKKRHLSFTLLPADKTRTYSKKVD